MADGSDFKCQRCGSANLGAFVQYGSYFTRCLSCGQDGWATSWLALAKQITDGPIRAIVVDEQQNEIEVLGEGRGEGIAAKISQAAHRGSLVHLLSATYDA